MASPVHTARSSPTQRCWPRYTPNRAVSHRVRRSRNRHRDPRPRREPHRRLPPTDPRPRWRRPHRHARRRRSCEPHGPYTGARGRSEEHTSELQSRFDFVCLLLLEKKKKSLIKGFAYTATLQSALPLYQRDSRFLRFSGLVFFVSVLILVR